MDGSYVRGVTEPGLLPITIGQALDDAASRWPDRDAVICPAQSIRLSWRDLQARAEDVAAGLLSQGLKPGDRVGIWSLNRAEWVMTHSPPPRPA
jgi:fatty-acyl-CoA synthase